MLGLRGTAMAASGAGLALCAALAMWSGGAVAQQAERPPEKIYDNVCGYCHGKNVGPIILGRKLPAESVKLFVRTGFGAMPAFKPTEITDEELDALAQWISASEEDDTEHGK